MLAAFEWVSSKHFSRDIFSPRSRCELQTVKSLHDALCKKLKIYHHANVKHRLGRVFHADNFVIIIARISRFRRALKRIVLFVCYLRFFKITQILYTDRYVYQFIKQLLTMYFNHKYILESFIIIQ